MKRIVSLALLTVSVAFLDVACSQSTSTQVVAQKPEALVGAWRAKVTFSKGALAEMKDLEFLYAYNAGGTMTESSNYDEAANSSPPAYGVWKQIDARHFQTKYVFFTTQSSATAAGAVKGSDWWPAGHGELTETITLSEDGRTYASTIMLAIFDKTGKPIDGGGEGNGVGTRIGF